MLQPMRAHSLSYLDARSTNKLSDEPITSKNAQSTVTCTYLTHICGKWRNVTVLWCKNLMTHCLTISIDGLKGDYHHSCKIDLKSWHFWSKKGYKLFELDGDQVDVYWDMRSVKYSGSPEPCSDYYVALVSEEEVVLLLGDYKKKAYKRTKSRPAIIEPVLCNKKDHVFNRKYFTTRARFDQRKKEHDIVVESSTTGARDPVQVFWDVHAWFFGNPGADHGWFIFKPGTSESESDKEETGSSRNWLFMPLPEDE